MKSRTANSLLNILSSMVCQVARMLGNFVVRIIFLRTLGVEYLGINGLFSSILCFLSLSELGFGSAIVFSLYKPLAQQDEDKICALMQLYKKAYITIGLVILGLGLSIVPFLERFINLEAPLPINYRLCYLLFLANTVSPYLFFAYRTSIISASQRTYIVKKYELVCDLAMVLSQLVTLLACRSFYLYIAIPFLFQFLQNCLCFRKATQLYPVLRSKVCHTLEPAEKKAIWKNVLAMSIIRISTTVYQASDNILISILLGTAVVGLNANYLMVTGMVHTFLNLVFNSMLASVGNLNAMGTAEEKFRIFKRLQLLTLWFYGFSAVSLASLFNPFIALFFGRQYIFPQPVVLCMVLAFLVPGLLRAILLYKDACGLFWETRYRALASALVNLVASWLLIRLMGIGGAYLGTVICILTTTFLVDPVIVFRKIFQQKRQLFYHWYAASLLLVVAIYLLTSCCLRGLPPAGITAFVLRCAICAVVPNLLFLLCFCRSDEFAFFRQLFLNTCKFMFSHGNLHAE